MTGGKTGSRSPDVAKLLQENMVINSMDSWVRIEKAACAEAAGAMRLVTSKARAANTGMSAPPIAEGFGSDFEFHIFEAPTRAIDDAVDFLDGRVDFMKIDIEGGEPMALRGAKKTIAINPTIKIMLEWSPDQLKANGFSPSDFADESKETGLKRYSLVRSDHLGDGTPMSFNDLVHSDYQNIVLVRAE